MTIRSIIIFFAVPERQSFYRCFKCCIRVTCTLNINHSLFVLRSLISSLFLHGFFQIVAVARRRKSEILAAVYSKDGFVCVPLLAPPRLFSIARSKYANQKSEV